MNTTHMTKVSQTKKPHLNEIDETENFTCIILRTSSLMEGGRVFAYAQNILKIFKNHIRMN
jgi:predicted metal-dependent RNase